MIINRIHRIEWFIGLILFQVLILNNVYIAGVATPFLYVYFILRFSSGAPRNELMLWDLYIGLAIDIFSNTPGMNAAAAVLLALLHPLFLRLFTPRNTLDNIIPSSKSMGIASFLECLVVSVFTYHLTLPILEFFSLTSIPLLLLGVAPSTILTITRVVAAKGVRR